MTFIYDKKYNFTGYDEQKRNAEDAIRYYIKKEFEAYVQPLEFQMKETKFFSGNDFAAALPAERIIQVDFDKYCDYLALLKQRNGKLVISDIRKKHDYTMNALHHECQHIINYDDNADVFCYIEQLDISDSIKVGIKILLDEYIASSTAQKRYFVMSGALESLELLCTQAQNPHHDKQNLYIDMVKALSYCIAENNVLAEIGNTSSHDYFLQCLCGKEAIKEFTPIFADIQKILSEYTFERYEEYVFTSLKSMQELWKQLDACFSSNHPTQDEEIFCSQRIQDCVS